MREKDKALAFLTPPSVTAAHCADTDVGWYIDDIEVRIKAPAWTGDFEDGWGDWGADRGIWQVAPRQATALEGVLKAQNVSVHTWMGITLEMATAFSPVPL